MRRNFLWLVVLMALLPLTPTSHAQGEGTITVVRQSIEFPRIQLTVRVQQDGKSIAGLTDADFQIIGDEFDSLQVAVVSTKVNLAIVIDLPDGGALAEIQQVLRAYFRESSGYYQDGDNVVFVIQNNDSHQVRTLNSRTGILEFIGTLPRPANFNRYDEGIARAVEELNILAQADPTAQRQILIIGSYFGIGPDARDIGTVTSATFRDQGIPIYAIQAHTGTRSGHTATFRTAAEQGQGLFVEYRNSGNEPELLPLFDAIHANGASYELSYNSLLATSGERTVQLNVVQDGTTLSGTFTYDAPSIQEPIVELIDPSVGAEIVRAPLSEDDLINLSNPTYTVQAQVTFPDDYGQVIQKAVLIVSVDGVANEFTVDQPAVSASGVLEIEWDLTPFAPTGVADETIPVILQLEVTDQYGLLGVSENVDTTILLDLAAGGGTTSDNNSPANPADLPGFNPNTNPAANSGTEGVVLPSGTTSTTTQAIEEAEDTDTRLYWIIAGASSSIFFLLVLLLVMRRRRKKSQSRGRGGRVRQASGSAPATFAYLEIMRGAQTGQQIVMDKAYFTLGREVDSGADYAIYEFSNVSARHCSISERNGQFFIVDHNSTNGTFVNNQPLSPNLEIPLPPHAVVRMGKDFNSFEFRFVPVMAQKPSSAMYRTSIDQSPYPGGQAPVSPPNYGGYNAPASPPNYGGYNPPPPQAPPPQTPYYGGGQQANGWGENYDDQSWLDN